MTLGLGVTDNRDRVYGVLGMTHRDKDIPRLLYPDYAKSAPHTFRDAIRYIFAYEAEPGILQRLFHRDNDELLDTAWPSWVPRFDRNHDSRFDPGPLSNSYNQRNRRTIKQSSDDPDPVPEPESNILSLTGALPLAVTNISATEIYDECPWATMKQWLMEVVDMAPSVTADEPSSISPIIQLARTLMTGYTFQGQRAKDKDCQELLAFWELFAENRGGWRDIKDIGEINSTAEDPISKASRFYYAMKGPCSLRKFAVMSTDCLALVPRVCREGDVIAIMHTCIKPLALRPLKGGNFQLLGECYLDGYMWAEERDMLDQRGHKDIVFNIE
ncbi:hypothetical protein HII31_04493 [Pseudocercospora fuligena]|uniref:Heterokaryon incompatibility domain-containing protein n=1 Tax=Pseudocercospora fuligena TaxID=685502 RepID=A0A8H6RQ74_9PEZI|nr:hypothetical protein HII31_04493 [Pseudocercospora fuligena]